MNSQPDQQKRKGGRKELLTLEMAKLIVKLIEKMPEAGTPVTWANVLAHIKKELGYEFNRIVLLQKEWGGSKLIAQAFNEAKVVQRRLNKELCFREHSEFAPQQLGLQAESHLLVDDGEDDDELTA